MNEITQAAATLGRLGGKSTSPAKQQAARENGRKGGRPVRKTNIGERLEALEQRLVNGDQTQFNAFWELSVRLLHEWRERKLTDAEAERQVEEIERWL